MTGQKIPPYENEYLCFQTDSKTGQSEQCAKSWSMTKVIDPIFDIESFEDQYVILKSSLRSECLK